MNVQARLDAAARCKVALIAAAVALAATLPVGAHAQEYPARALKLIVPYPAGGTTDILPRIMQGTSRW
jgi:tripartite-type tricarboxylate transporter receptor subunit TctC